MQWDSQRMILMLKSPRGLLLACAIIPWAILCRVARQIAGVELNTGWLITMVVLTVFQVSCLVAVIIIDKRGVYRRN